MTAVEVPVPVEAPGEDVTNPPFPPVPARPHDGWVPAYPEWDDLTPREQVLELRRGAQSAYFDDFEADPAVWASCPTGMHPNPVVVVADGLCSHCGHDFMAGPGFVSVEDGPERFVA